jgi:hypothetical protein
MPISSKCPLSFGDLMRLTRKGSAKDNSMFDLPTPQSL